MPKGKGTYGSKRGRPAKKQSKMKSILAMIVSPLMKKKKKVK